MNRILLSIIALAIAFMVGSCATYPRANKNCGSKDATRNEKLYVVSHGWHTGIIMKPENLNHLMPSLVDRFPDCDYYEVGWGDAGFYQAHKITTKITLNAVVLPSDTVVHLVGFKGDPINEFSTSNLREVSLTSEGMDSLCEFVHSSFVRDELDKPKMLKAGLYGDSQFYEGQGKYHLFNGCNKWTAKALCSGGVEIDPTFKISSASVMDEIGTTKVSKTRTSLLRSRRGSRGF